MNMRFSSQQIGRIIDVSQAEVRRNGEWFGKFSFADVLALTGQIENRRLSIGTGCCQQACNNQQQEQGPFRHKLILRIMHDCRKQMSS